MVTSLLEEGWAQFPAEQAVLDWVDAVYPVACKRVRDPEERRQWLHCEGTWFVGVDALPNDPGGAVAGSRPLAGAAYAAARALYGKLPLHQAQISVIYPGYPKPREGEGDAAFQYRLKRDAAHVDGLLGVGPTKQRFLKERHAYILGLPLTECDANASPLSIWKGSHHVMREAFASVLSSVPQTEWDKIDLTDIYKAARREVFETCVRVTVPAKPGEAYLVHRLAVHGVAPWESGAVASRDGRMIAYFRPELPSGTRAWLELP